MGRDLSFRITAQWVRVILLLTVSQSDLALSPYLELMAICLLYNRDFLFCMSFGSLPDGWTGLSRKGPSPCLWICVSFYFICFFVVYLFGNSFLFLNLHTQPAQGPLRPRRWAPEDEHSPEHRRIASPRLAYGWVCTDRNLSK